MVENFWFFSICIPSICIWGSEAAPVKLELMIPEDAIEFPSDADTKNM